MCPQQLPAGEKRREAGSTARKGGKQGSLESRGMGMRMLELISLQHSWMEGEEEKLAVLQEEAEEDRCLQ